MTSRYKIQSRVSPSHGWEDEDGGDLPTLNEAKRVIRAWLQLEGGSKYRGNIRIFNNATNKVAWGTVTEKEILGAARPVRPARVPKMKIFRNVPVHEILAQIGATDQSDWEANPNMMDYADEAADGFVNSWIETEFDEEEVPVDEIKDAVSEAVNYKVQDNVSHSIFLKMLSAVKYALDNALEHAKVPGGCEVDEKRGTFTIEVDSDAIVRAWAEETEGMGYTAWDDSLGADDIESAKMLINILEHRASVYGYHDMKWNYDWYFDRFEPDTGSYMELAKVAREAWRKHLSEKHKAGTKHRGSGSSRSEQLLAKIMKDAGRLGLDRSGELWSIRSGDTFVKLAGAENLHEVLIWAAEEMTKSDDERAAAFSDLAEKAESLTSD